MKLIYLLEIILIYTLKINSNSCTETTTFCFIRVRNKRNFLELYQNNARKRVEYPLADTRDKSVLNTEVAVNDLECLRIFISKVGTYMTCILMR